MAVLSLGFISGSELPPSLTAIVISFAILEKIFDLSWSICLLRVWMKHGVIDWFFFDLFFTFASVWTVITFYELCSEWLTRMSECMVEEYPRPVPRTRSLKNIITAGCLSLHRKKKCGSKVVTGNKVMVCCLNLLYVFGENVWMYGGIPKLLLTSSKREDWYSNCWTFEFTSNEKLCSYLYSYYCKVSCIGP